MAGCLSPSAPLPLVVGFPPASASPNFASRRSAFWAVRPFAPLRVLPVKGTPHPYVGFASKGWAVPTLWAYPPRFLCAYGRAHYSQRAGPPHCVFSPKPSPGGHPRVASPPGALLATFGGSPCLAPSGQFTSRCRPQAADEGNLPLPPNSSSASIPRPLRC